MNDFYLPVAAAVVIAVIFAISWLFERKRTAPLRDRRGMAARARRTFYVRDATGRRVRLEDALAELGLLGDGK